MGRPAREHEIARGCAGRLRARAAAMAASFQANVLRGIGAGVGGYCVLFPLASWLGPRLCPSCAALPTDQRGEWCAKHRPPTATKPPPQAPRLP